MYGIYHFDGAEVKLPLSSVVHRMAFDTLVAIPGYNFEVSNNFGIAFFYNGFGIGYVIFVAVCKQVGRYLYGQPAD